MKEKTGQLKLIGSEINVERGCSQLNE